MDGRKYRYEWDSLMLFGGDDGPLALLASASLVALATLFYFFVSMGTAGP